MLKEPEGVALLHPLVHPTLKSFAEANKITAREREEFADERKTCVAPMLGSKDGNDFWVYFAGLLHEEFAALPGVARVEGNHALSSAWDVGGVFRLHLKRDVAAFDFNQLSFDLGDSSSPHDEVVLSWTHQGPERVAPRFVHSTADKQIVWSRSVASLLIPEAADAVVETQRRGVNVKSARDEQRISSDVATEGT